MKIGVITTQYSTNYGALLQAYALQQYIKKYYTNDVEVLNYWPPHGKKYWKLFGSNKGWKNKLLNAYRLCHPRLLLKKRKLIKVFGAFLEENLQMSKEYYDSDMLQSAKDEYSILICGSDQIWNITRRDDPVWFLYFAKDWDNVKKIAYSPSVADPIPPGHEENLKKYLANLDYISVRESNDVEQLQKFTDKEIKHVCDPVFLLKPEEWEERIPDIKVKEPYILCYFISVGDYAYDVVQKIKELTGWKVVYINVNDRDKLKSDKCVRTATPFEFVGYFKNASFVVTNSFHCTAFSVLFKKDFYVIKKNTANSRMESLMNKVKMEDRFVTKDSMDLITKDTLKIDYSKCDYEQWIEESKAYLERTING